MEANIEMIITPQAFREIVSKLDSIIKNLEPRADAQEEWMDKPSVLKLLRVSPSTLQTYRDKGLIKYSQVGRKILYEKKDIVNFLTNSKK